MEGLYSFSQVVAADENDSAARELARALGGLPVSANPNLEPGSIALVIADDYTGPGALDADNQVEFQEPVGTPGADFGEAEVAPEITAGGSGPRCVN